MAVGLRQETDDLVRLASSDLDRVWRLLNEGASPEEALRDLLPAVIREFGALGSVAAAEWYDDQRSRTGAAGRFEAAPIEADDRGTQALIGWALDTATDDAALRTLILGGTQHRIADHLRLTITQNSIVDTAAQGWIRVGEGECDWCQQYLDGEIHYVEGYDFAAHDWCRCDAVPAF